MTDAEVYLSSIAKSNKALVGLLIALLIMFLVPMVIYLYTTFVFIDAAKRVGDLAHNTNAAGLALFSRK